MANRCSLDYVYMAKPYICTEICDICWNAEDINLAFFACNFNNFNCLDPHSLKTIYSTLHSTHLIFELSNHSHSHNISIMLIDFTQLWGEMRFLNLFLYHSVVISVFLKKSWSPFIHCFFYNRCLLPGSICSVKKIGKRHLGLNLWKRTERFETCRKFHSYETVVNFDKNRSTNRTR